MKTITRSTNSSFFPLSLRPLSFKNSRSCETFKTSISPLTMIASISFELLLTVVSSLISSFIYFSFSFWAFTLLFFSGSSFFTSFFAYFFVAFLPFFFSIWQSESSSKPHLPSLSCSYLIFASYYLAVSRTSSIMSLNCFIPSRSGIRRSGLSSTADSLRAWACKWL